MLIGRHKSRLLIALIAFILFFSYLAFEKIDLYFKSAPSADRGMQLFVSICYVLAVLLLLSFIHPLYFKNNTIDGNKVIYISMDRASYLTFKRSKNLTIRHYKFA